MKRLSPICRIPYDLPPGMIPKAGDYLVSQGKRGLGSGYLILEARLMKRRKPVRQCRWMLVCERVEVREILAASMTGKVWTIYWYSRDAKKRRRVF